MVGQRRTGDRSPKVEAPFGARLRKLREARGFTQEELASRAGLSPNAVGALERGARKRPYPHTVRALADALGLDDEERAALWGAVPGRGKAAPSAADAVPPVSASELPRPTTSLLGREEQLEEVTGLLVREGVRLLTLTGVGGVGKTRLALGVASRAEGLFADGVAFVALAPLGDPALVVGTIARALGLREAQERPTREVLQDYLREKHLLLVLDNLEHVLGAAPEVAGLLEACPGLTVLATSRAPLRLRGEREVAVAPLGLPDSSRDPEAVAGSASGRLFLERARASSPSFDLTRHNAADVAAICRRLAGLPLALELAAAKARFLDPAALLARLDRALSTAGARDLPERQRTVRAALDWSHGLLSEAERALLRRLSVFAGGFTLSAAEALGTEDTLDLLGGLVEQSLVTVDLEAGGEVRYGLLEPVRQYAREMLEEAGEFGETRGRQAAFFLALAEDALAEMRGPEQVGWLERLERENGNLRAAMFWALAQTDGAGLAVRLGWSLWVFWWLRGHQGEGRRWMEALLMRDLPPGLRARAAQVANAMAYTQGDFGACEGYSREALKLSRRVGDELCEAYALCGLGLEALGRGGFADATARFGEARPLFARAGEEGMLPILRVWTGTALLLEGRRDEAIPVFEEGLSLARGQGDRLGTYNALYNLAQVAMGGGDQELAARMFEEGIELSEQMKDRANLAYFLEGLALTAGMRGDVERAATLSGASEGLLQEAGAPVYNYYAPDPASGEKVAGEARAVLGDAAYAEAREAGRAMTFEEAVAYARPDAQTRRRARS